MWPAPPPSIVGMWSQVFSSSLHSCLFSNISCSGMFPLADPGNQPSAQQEHLENLQKFPTPALHCLHLKTAANLHLYGCKRSESKFCNDRPKVQTKMSRSKFFFDKAEITAAKGWSAKWPTRLFFDSLQLFCLCKKQPYFLEGGASLLWWPAPGFNHMFKW